MKRLYLFQKQGKGVGFGRGKVRVRNISEGNLILRLMLNGHMTFQTSLIHDQEIRPYNKISNRLLLGILDSALQIKVLLTLQGTGVTLCTCTGHVFYESGYATLYVCKFTEEKTCIRMSEIPTG